MLSFSAEQIQSWERVYRTNFINSLSGFKSATLIGTKNSNGQLNLAIFSNIVHIGADPALIGFINRPLEASPHTIANIEASGVYSMNLIAASMIEPAHQTSAKYAANENEFEQTGLTAQYMNEIDIPFVLESPVKYAMKLKEIIPVKLNNTFLVIGAVTAVFIDEMIVQQDGFIALDKADVITSLGVDGYYSTMQLARFSYAKPHRDLTKVNETNV